MAAGALPCLSGLVETAPTIHVPSCVTELLHYIVVDRVQWFVCAEHHLQAVSLV